MSKGTKNFIKYGGPVFFNFIAVASALVFSPYVDEQDLWIEYVFIAAFFALIAWHTYLVIDSRKNFAKIFGMVVFALINLFAFFCLSVGSMMELGLPH